MSPKAYQRLCLMIILFIVGLVILELAGCQKTDEIPVKPVRNQETFEISIEFVSEERAAEMCASYGVNVNVPNSVERGCTLFYPDESRCEVIVPTPKYVDDNRTTILGHEVLHCYAGRYH